VAKGTDSTDASPWPVNHSWNRTEHIPRNNLGPCCCPNNHNQSPIFLANMLLFLLKPSVLREANVPILTCRLCLRGLCTPDLDDITAHIYKLSIISGLSLSNINLTKWLAVVPTALQANLSEQYLTVQCTVHDSVLARETPFLLPNLLESCRKLPSHSRAPTSGIQTPDVEFKLWKGWVSYTLTIHE